MRRVFRNVALLLAALAGAWLAAASPRPPFSIEVLPPNPVAGQTVRLLETSRGAAAGIAWLWDFGDGDSSEAAAPSHGWASPGTYTIRLTSRGTTVERDLVVSPEDTLRLNGTHPFEIQLTVFDPQTSAATVARAAARTDLYGGFRFSDAEDGGESLDFTVQVADAGRGGSYGIYWTAMTPLPYVLTVRDVSTGHVEIYDERSGLAREGSDTTSFPALPARSGADAESPSRQVVEGPERGQPRDVPPRGASKTPAGPTATPTRTPTGPTRTPTHTHTSAPTWTPTITPTPSITPTPTITPVPTPTFISLRATQWRWKWCPPPFSCPTVCPDPCGDNEITLHVGTTYQVFVYNGDGDDVLEPHGLFPIDELGLTGGLIPQGGALPIQYITPDTPGDYNIKCSNTMCGPPDEHENMIGAIHVVP